MLPFAAPRDRRRLSSRRFVAKLAPLWLAGIRLNVLFGCAVDQRQNFVLDRLDRRHGRAPLRSVPLDERDSTVTIVIGAAQMDRCRKPRQPNLLPTGIGDFECLRTAWLSRFSPTLSFDMTWLLPLSTTYLGMSWIAGYECTIPLGFRACRAGIVVAPRPPYAEQTIHREADLYGFLDRGRVHGATALQIDPVEPIAPHFKPQ